MLLVKVRCSLFSEQGAPLLLVEPLGQHRGDRLMQPEINTLLLVLTQEAIAICLHAVRYDYFVRRVHCTFEGYLQRYMSSAFSSALPSLLTCVWYTMGIIHRRSAHE